MSANKGRPAPETRWREPEPAAHRCSKCFGPYGKSAIRCVNEPKETNENE